MTKPPFDAAAWETLEPFRRTFLLHLTAEERARVVGFGDLLFELVLQRPAPEQGGPSPVLAELRAIGEELDYLARHLRDVVLRTHGAGTASADEERWKRMGEWLASEVLRLASGLEEGLAAAKRVGEDTDRVLLEPWFT